ncbi:MAG TPA: gamma-glutamylcyclotransferase family protein [Arenicellales bacterium]|nr:gamma-glutamylcyclotransferase family protein [Arenicellales bacterium]
MQRETSPFYPSRDADAGLEEDRRAFLERAVVSLGLPALFYGSLRDPKVFEAVVGRPFEACDWQRVAIRGFRLGIANAGTGCPGLFPGTPGEAELDCLIVHDLNRFEQTLVAWYEWDEYVLRPIPLADGRRAQAFVPDLDAIRREYGEFKIEPWSFDTWHANGVDRALATARQWMAQRPDSAALARSGFFGLEECQAGTGAAG